MVLLKQSNVVVILEKVKIVHHGNIYPGPRGFLTFGFALPLVRAFGASESEKTSGTRVGEKESRKNLQIY